MELKNFLRDVEARTAVSKFMQLLLIGSMTLNILLAAMYLSIDKSVRTQLVPPEITKSFWVDGKRLSPEYLDQMGDYVVAKFASVTPATIDVNNALLLRYVHPTVFGELSVRFKTAAEKLKREGIARHFFVKEVQISEDSQSAAYIGLVETWVGDKKLPSPEYKAYLVGFQYEGGVVTIRELRETSPEKPFAPPTAAAKQNP